MNGNQSAISPFTVNVDDRGFLENGDWVVIDAGSTIYRVNSRTETTVELINFEGILNLIDDQRISPISARPTLFVGVKGTETTPNPITTGSDGRAIAWLPGGFYDYRISGPGVTTELVQDVHIAPRGTIIDVTQAPYYAKFDGATDDTIAIRRALDDALLFSGGNNGGAIVQLPAGVAIISSTINIGESSDPAFPGIGRVIFRGSGKRTTKLKAAASFTFNGSTTSMLRIGAGLGNNMHDTRIEDLELDCNNAANSIGFYSTNCQEGSGLSNVNVTNYKVKAYFFNTSGCQNSWHSGLEAFHTSTTAIALDVNAVVSRPTFIDITFASNNATQSTNPAIRLTNSLNVHLESVHIEHHNVGVNFGTGSSGSLIACYGQPGIVDLVKIDTFGVYLLNVQQGGATNVINNTVNGDGAFSIQGECVYFQGNEALGATEKFRLSNSELKGTRLVGPFTANHRRFRASAGTSLVNGDFALSAGWGNTATVVVTSGSTDSRGTATITANGSSIAPNPTATLTFKDGAYTTVPFILGTLYTDNADPAAGIEIVTVVTSTTTQTTFQLLGTPVAGRIYTFAWITIQ